MGSIQKFSLFVVFVVLTQLGFGTSQELVPGTPIELVRGDASSEPLKCKGFWGVRCASCSKLQVCLDDVEVALHNCGDVNQNTPFCTNRACSATPSDECKDELPVSSFTCTDSGQFPNPNNCSRYFICPDAGQPPREHECPSLYVYDSRLGQCKRRNNFIDCQQIDCSRSPDKFIVFSGDKSILAYCKRNAEFPVLTRCPDIANQEYDPYTLECTFVCRSEGRYVDKLDCQKYYQCYRNGVSFVKVHGNCSPLVYNPSSQLCQRSVQGCQNQITTTTAVPATNPSPNPPISPSDPPVASSTPAKE